MATGNKTGQVTEKKLLLGNEAIAVGCIDGGVKFAAAYPGTPSSEILQTIAAKSKQYDVVTEWSTNEMVAFEKAMGYSLCGMRSMVSMKHAGLNWVADPFSVAYLGGVVGGVLVITADDPNCHSSANEQDNRFYGLFFETLVLEPSSPLEAKEMAKQSFAISEEIEMPVIMRSVTRVSHARSGVEDAAAYYPSLEGNFVPNRDRYWISSDRSLRRHRLVHERQALMQEIGARSGLNRYSNVDADTCIIASGVAWQYVSDVLDGTGLTGKVSTLKLGVVQPVNEDVINRALSEHDQVIIIEEGEPFVELQVRALSSKLEHHSHIYGRHDGAVPYCGELTYERVQDVLAQILNIEDPVTSENAELRSSLKEELDQISPGRGMFYCAGCPHNATSYVLSEITRKMDKKPPIAGDIGCYVLAAMPPYNLGDVKYSMGASISVASGLSEALGRKAVALIGDGTFYHAGMPGMLNASYNGANIVVLIVDNATTGMTGGQPNPGTGSRADGSPAREIKLEDVVSTFKPDSLDVVDAYDLEATREALSKAFDTPGVAVVITRQRCAMEYVRDKRKMGEAIVQYRVDPEKCTACMRCVRRFNCMAISKEEDLMVIDDTCMGCGVCALVCPSDAIERVEGGSQ